MGQHSKWLVVHIVAAMLSAGTAWSSAHDGDAERRTLVVRVDNLAAVSRQSLLFAEGRAAEIFSRIGVRVDWIDGEAPMAALAAIPLTVVLVNEKAMGGEAPLAADPLGAAQPLLGRAYIFCNRIEALRVRSPRSIAGILGDVLAHEIGHLLLPLPGHSAAGIMRPGVNLRRWSPETFTSAQARVIQSRLRHLP